MSGNSNSDNSRTLNGGDSGSNLSITDTDSRDSGGAATTELRQVTDNTNLNPALDISGWIAPDAQPPRVGAPSSPSFRYTLPARDDDMVVTLPRESGYSASEASNTAAPVNDPAPAPASDTATDPNATMLGTDPHLTATTTIRELRPLIRTFMDETVNLDWHFQGLQARPAQGGSEHGSVWGPPVEPELVAHDDIRELQAQGRVLAEQLEVVVLRAQGLRGRINALNQALKDMDG